MLSRKELFARLAEGAAARITVVTPNRRLAQALLAGFDAFQKEKTVWEAPDILPLASFVERLYEDALYSELASGLPVLLTAAQENLLWREAIAESKRELLVVEQAAAQCRDAWRLAHAWRITPGGASEDSAAFAEWAALYKRKTARVVDGARLADLVAELAGKLKPPRLLVLYAFDIVTPQARALFAALEAAGTEVVQCHPEARTSTSSRTLFPSAREELEAAAAWARGRLEAGHARIGVVVPELEQRRREVVRVFSRVLGRADAFNVSLGQPLSDYPLVDAALSLVRLAHDELAFARASALVRSPFIGAAESESAARARFDVRLRRDAPPSVSLPKLLGLVDGCPELRALLEKLFALREKGASSKPPSEWARHFSALLDGAGYPGERALDSDEYQALAKWHEVLAEFARLDGVTKGLPFKASLPILERLCRDTLFQPESAEAPIQVLGILESAGLEFDCLWVSGLTLDAWPLDARPNPFIPIGLQKKAGIPEASIETSTALDRRITEGWLGAAAEVVVSSFAMDEDREVSPSPLITQIALGKVEVPVYPRHRDLIFQSRKILESADSRAPRLPTAKTRGGTRVLADQAACPFRAFARWRLGAQPLEAPSEGLDASDRGRLLHALMANLWNELKASSALQGEVFAAVKKAAESAVKSLGIEGRFAELERERLERLAMDWLELERARAPFEVRYVEKTLPIQVGGLELEGRIDRMDRLENGAHVLIDYKTGGSRPGTRAWLPPRMDDPQLPVYATSVNEPVAAVTFAALRPGDMRFVGASRDDKVLPKVRRDPKWADTMRGWADEAQALGASFVAGEARVDPKRGVQTCRNCALQTLCRVYEKINVLAELEEEF